jgi:hypothetical protein
LVSKIAAPITLNLAASSPNARRASTSRRFIPCWTRRGKMQASSGMQWTT